MLRDTIAEMKEPAEDYSGFVEEYCPNGSEEQCADIFNLMLSGETDKFEVKAQCCRQPQPYLRRCP